MPSTLQLFSEELHQSTKRDRFCVFLSSHFLLTHKQLLVFWFAEAVSQVTFATIMSITVTGHKIFSTAFIWRTLKVINFVVLIYLILFQDSQPNLLSLMLILLGSGTRLLPFLSVSRKSQHKVKCGLIFNVLVKVPPSSSCLPVKISLGWSGGVPSSC